MRELNEMDDDIEIRISSFSGMPRASGGLPSSPVERQAEFREEKKERLLENLEDLEKHSRKMERALNQLSPLERKVIELSYLKVNFISDHGIANHLGIDTEKMREIKKEALAKVWEVITRKTLSDVQRAEYKDAGAVFDKHQHPKDKGIVKASERSYQELNLNHYSSFRYPAIIGTQNPVKEAIL